MAISYKVFPGTPYYSNTSLTAQAGTIVNTIAASYVNNTYGTVSINGSTYYVAYGQMVSFYNSSFTGAQIDDAISKVRNPDTTPTKDSTNLITSGGVESALDAFMPPLDHYDGKDLTVAFASEISNYASVWAWLKARLTSKDISGIFVKDYISFQTTEATPQTIIAQVAGINHDLQYSTTKITEWHIDFISKDCWNAYVRWNLKGYNNGISTETAPWCASNIKAFLNAEAASVPDATTADPATTAVDYTSTGVYALLPMALKNVIVDRLTTVPTRYTAGSLLQQDNSFAWKQIGKLWLPDETEVYGQVASGTQGVLGVGASHQYEIFRDGKTRIKGLGNGGERQSWWLRTEAGGTSASACFCAANGTANYISAGGQYGFPVCFRVSG